MGDTTSPRRPVRLEFAADRVIPPADLDAYSLSAARAAEAFRDPVPDGERLKHFEARLLLPLRRWCDARAAKVERCVLPLPNRYIDVFIVTTSRRYDFDLGDEIAALELQLARAGWRIGVMQLPAADESSLAAFFKPDGALEFGPRREAAVGEPAPFRHLDL